MLQEIKKEKLAHPSPDLIKVIEARHHDPFTILGRHDQGDTELFRAFIPKAETIFLGPDGPEMLRFPGTDLFELSVAKSTVSSENQLIWVDQQGKKHRIIDPYRFLPQLSDFDLDLFSAGKHQHLYRILGANARKVNGVEGVLFATWAPNAQRVSVVGNFNEWDGRCHPMRVRGDSGVWELFLPQLQLGEPYKFEIKTCRSDEIVLKSDPFGRQFEIRPSTASILVGPDTFRWHDQKWTQNKQKTDWLHSPLSIYEIHLGSWRKDENGDFLNFRELAHQLVDYIRDTGFTHIELLPISEHPLDASWGYQTTGYFAPTSRHGNADDFRYFVDYCHCHSIGVLLDWVPAHFPKDGHGLAHFDGSALYEHEDPRLGEHKDWGTNIYNFGRKEVKNFLLSNALFWLEEFHIDGLRVDAVASMLYLDYSRESGEWIPNKYGGNENLEAVDFIRELNTLTHDQHPGTLIIAEESTAWPQVSRPTWAGGLGFSMKWNMGWMNDTLSYMSKNPIHRHFHQDQLTFGMLYAYTENFVLPFSHDEVVHGKSSLINKMPGDEWQRFANLRLLYTYMFTFPGKKLLFMGCEFAQGEEWNVDNSLEWYVLDYPLHQGIKTLVTDLNHVYAEQKPLHHFDFDPQGFEWIDCHDSEKSILSYIRKSDHGTIVVILNFTPIPRHNYRIGVPENGSYREIINSDSTYYGGSDVGNGLVEADPIPWMDRSYSVNLTLPPLAGILLKFHQS